jgi:PKD repeat protein
MKVLTRILLAMFLLTGYALTAQVAVTFKPDATVGQDAMILRNDVCTNWVNTNWGNNAELDAYAWTWYANNCGPGAGRSLLRFDELNTLPPGATILYAELRLFGLATSGNSQGNSTYPGSPYGTTNELWVREVTSGWNENTVTWNTQPSATTTGQLAIPASTLRWNENATLDVTAMVTAMVSGANNGFLILLQNENYYRSRLFASSDHPDATLWPELYVKYALPCDAHFTYCVSTSNPGLYNFTVDNPQPGFTYKWDFGDGNSAVGTAVSNNYPSGSYQVCLYAYSDDGSVECKQCVKICVENPNYSPCSVKFDYYVENGVHYFKGYEDGVNGPVVSAEWDFGDGSPLTSYNYYWPETKHIYERPGIYKVCVTVKYENGCVARYCINISARTAAGVAKTSAKQMETLPKPDVPVLADIAVLPNPVNEDVVNVRLDLAHAGQYQYRLLDNNGKTVLNGSKMLVKGAQTVQLQATALAPGKYWISFDGKQQQYRVSFIKL